jgi:hypothetical protein
MGNILKKQLLLIRCALCSILDDGSLDLEGDKKSAEKTAQLTWMEPRSTSSHRAQRERCKKGKAIYQSEWSPREGSQVKRPGALHTQTGEVFGMRRLM